MNNNLEIITQIIDYIEKHLTFEKLDLEQLAKVMNYSPYHLHRMFTNIIGFTLHQYITRRRLTLAAHQLIFTEDPILEIALNSGYETQRSFSSAFKKLYHSSPNHYRKKKQYLPLQLPFDIHNCQKRNGDMIQSIEIKEAHAIYLVGYTKSTQYGFHVIGQCWHKMHKNKHLISSRIDSEFLIGVNDYHSFTYDPETPHFSYMAAAQVSEFQQIPKGMQTLTLSPSQYAVFSWHGKNQESMQDIIEYVYQEWFLHSTCQFNENNLYDFIKYGEVTDENGESEIQLWVPIIQ